LINNRKEYYYCLKGFFTERDGKSRERKRERERGRKSDIKNEIKLIFYYCICEIIAKNNNI